MAKNENVKVIVVGGGGAGLCASIAAVEAGAAGVTLMEKMPKLGGDTIISGMVISAGGTHLQEQAGVQDTPHQYLIDLLAGGRYTSDLMLAATLVQSGPAAWEWLTKHDCQFPGPEGLHVQHDHTLARSVKFAPPGMISPLKQAAEARGVNIMLSSPVQSLVLEDGRVAGVIGEKDGQTTEYLADSVILATGGFGRNKDMVNQYNPKFAEAASWNSLGITGDGITLAQAAGADVVQMEALRIIQTGADVRVKVLHPTYLMGQIRALGGILVNPDGKRFYDEMGRSYEMIHAAMAHGPFYFLIFDAKMATPSQWLPEKTFEEQLNAAVKDGMVAMQADTVKELADQMGAPALVETVQRWNADTAEGEDTVCRRIEGLNPITEPPFYAIRYKPAIVQTLGGVRIDTRARVLDQSGRPIPGLYAAGQVTGGIHGADYIGGSALLECAVYGIIAGQQAVIDV
ncbi:MAG: flavocytochrome c [Anaerolineae bacterium]|nr:flavocytochrome c [Anaerolineae bacterium]